METAILAMAGSGATAAGTSAALGTATGVATAGQVAMTAPVLASAGGSLLSGGLTAASLFGTLKAGQSQSAMYKAQAQQYELSARAEELKGRDQADKIRRTLQTTLASQNAAFGARGINLNSGTARSLATQSMEQATADISKAQFGAGSATEAARMQASQERIAGKTAKVQSYTSAGALGFNALNGKAFSLV